MDKDIINLVDVLSLEPNAEGIKVNTNLKVSPVIRKMMEMIKMMKTNFPVPNCTTRSLSTFPRREAPCTLRQRGIGMRHSCRWESGDAGWC